MSVENAVRLMAGTFIAASLVLYYLVSPWYLLLAAFVSFNLIQSSFTGFCPAEMIFKKVLPNRATQPTGRS
jgi:hypothetical protein